MDTTLLLIWVPKIFYSLMFIIIGIWALRNKNVEQKYIYWLIIVYFIERVVEVSFRTYFTKISLETLDPGSFAYLRFEALIGPSLRAIIFSQIIIIVIALIVWALLMLYAKKTSYQKIDKTDVLIFSFGTLIAGWPNFIIYIGLVFIFATIGLLAMQIFKYNENDRMIVTPYFALAGVVIIFFGIEISKLIGLYALR